MFVNMLKIMALLFFFDGSFFCAGMRYRLWNVY
jgi:hypothetical protein